MTDDAEPRERRIQPFVPACAIGAPAGGVAALQGLFRQLPANLGPAHVVIPHLSPDQPSAPSEILSACTRMPVLRMAGEHQALLAETARHPSRRRSRRNNRQGQEP